MREENQAATLKRIIVTCLGITAFATIIYGLARYWKQRLGSKPKQYARFKPTQQGLTEAEAAERHSDERVEARLLMQQQMRLKRRKRNIFSIFNLTILALAVSQLFLQDILGAVGTLATLVLNILINSFQETRAAKQVDELANKARPRATVIRSGRLRSIDQDDIVVGDFLVAGRGDEILADGVLVESASLTIDESRMEEQDQIVSKNPGEPLKAGTYCASGWAVYRIERINIEKPDGENQTSRVLSSQSTTPLQNIVQRVLYVLLFFAGIFYISIMLEVVRSDILPPDIMDVYRDVMSIIFSIAPGGLFFMIVINYAIGSADIARSGALVRNSLSIESLAQVSTVCLIRRGGVTGINIELEMIPSSSDLPELDHNRARQTLGNYVHSLQGDKFPLTILKEKLEGEQRSFDQQARYLSIFGWEAATFTSTDMPGSYVIGYPDVLKPHILETKLVNPDRDQSTLKQNGQQGIRDRLGNWLRRGKSDSQPAAAERLPARATPAISNVRPLDAGIEPGSSRPASYESIFPESGQVPQDEKKSDGALHRFQVRLTSLLRRRGSTKDQAEQQSNQDHTDEILRLMFAYSPSPQLIYDANNQPLCPKELIPVCFIQFVEEVRPEVQKAVQTFMDAGVSIKILADDEPMRALAIAQELGIVKVEPDHEPVATGDEITDWTPNQLREVVLKKSIFALLSSDQMVRIIGALQEQGEYVAVLGSTTSDLQVMKQANLSITRQGSGPKLLDNANIVLLKNSPNALPEVLQKGQSIVNGLMDVLKLNLSQIAYSLILLIVMFVLGERIFFFHPTQGGAIGIFTIVIPAFALSLWSSTTPIRRTKMHLQLVHFIVPAAALTSIFVVLVHIFFSNANASIAYNQLGVTHLLVVTGLILVIFVQPPMRNLSVGNEFSGGWRTTFVAGGLFVVFQVATRVPLVQRYLRLGPLENLYDYLFVWGISLIWAILTLGLWRMHWLKRVLDWSSRWMVSSNQ